MVTVGYDVSRFVDDVDEELFCAICGQVGLFIPNVHFNLTRTDANYAPVLYAQYRVSDVACSCEWTAHICVCGFCLTPISPAAQMKAHGCVVCIVLGI